MHLEHFCNTVKLPVCSLVSQPWIIPKQAPTISVIAFKNNNHPLKITLHRSLIARFEKNWVWGFQNQRWKCYAGLELTQENGKPKPQWIQCSQYLLGNESLRTTLGELDMKNIFKSYALFQSIKIGSFMNRRSFKLKFKIKLP